ncbi:MAG: HNH endonuclease [Pseudanabaena sp. M110S1SP2A07QC]|nr:HNH endonuclease [Pseudanabaena sp. M110S1SP2A07QC]
MCGAGRENGAELHVDHIKPKDMGGLATIENGQTLCSQHNFLKKNLKQTETGKKIFIHLYELSKKEGNLELQKFCIEILQTFENFNINGHIEWKK